MTDRPRKGDRVRWKSHGGEAVGKVEAQVTEDTEAAGRQVRASPADPQYLVKSDKSGGEAVHKAGVLHPDPAAEGNSAEGKPGRDKKAKGTAKRGRHRKRSF